MTSNGCRVLFPSWFPYLTFQYLNWTLPRFSRETDRQTDRQRQRGDRQTDRHAGRQAGRQWHKQTGRQSDREYWDFNVLSTAADMITTWNEGQTGRQTDRLTDRQTQRDRDTETQREGWARHRQIEGRVIKYCAGICATTCSLFLSSLFLFQPWKIGCWLICMPLYKHGARNFRAGYIELELLMRRLTWWGKKLYF